MALRLCALVLLGLMSACGQKGPLVLPDAPTATRAAPPARAEALPPSTAASAATPPARPTPS